MDMCHVTYAVEIRPDSAGAWLRPAESNKIKIRCLRQFLVFSAWVSLVIWIMRLHPLPN